MTSILSVVDTIPGPTTSLLQKRANGGLTDVLLLQQ